MRKIALLILTATLAACGAAPKDVYERRAVEERERQERYVDRAIDKAPKWMTELPKSTSAVYANGTAVSPDFSMADEKAKVVALGKVCMSAGGQVDKNSRVFRSDIGEQSAEHSTMAIRSMCRTVDVSGAEVVEIKRVAEGTKFRSYVLVALPIGSANAIQQRKDQLRAQQLVNQQAEKTFRDMDDKAKSE